MPLIGITSRTISRTSAEFVVGQNYTDAILRAGGAPVLLPGIADKAYCEKILSAIDGLIISGGDDMDPAFYGEEPHPKLGLVDVQKGNFEFMLTRMALRKNIPILGICGGIQMLNVAAGGTLYQDIPSQTGSGIKHSQELTKSVPSHYVAIEKNTRLHKILGMVKLRVNSTHHQAVKDLAKDFVVAARAADGIVEAIEMQVKRFVIGVQWHPESLAAEHPVFQKVFDTFIKECSH